ncbi:hypothetical protein HK101_000203 [Irineochytrium annulatum]|nr:hypothetical protein HK101_000203 [Irineochytrium annulatum]
MFSPRNDHLAKPDPLGEYFFDRDPDAFRAVLNFYRSDVLERPANVSERLFKKELDFWQIEAPTDDGDTLRPSSATPASSLPPELKPHELKIIIMRMLKLMADMGHPIEWYAFMVGLEGKVSVPPEKRGCDAWVAEVERIGPFIAQAYLGAGVGEGGVRLDLLHILGGISLEIKDVKVALPAWRRDGKQRVAVYGWECGFHRYH